MDLSNLNIFMLGNINKVRFESPQGKTGLTIEQLFDLPLYDIYHRVANLDDIAPLLDSTRVKTKSFVHQTETIDEILELKFKIVIEVIKYKQAVQAEREAKLKAKEEAKETLSLIEEIKNKNKIKKVKKLSSKELEKLKAEAEAKLKN